MTLGKSGGGRGKSRRVVGELLENEGRRSGGGRGVERVEGREGAVDQGRGGLVDEGNYGVDGDDDDRVPDQEIAHSIEDLAPDLEMSVRRRGGRGEDGPGSGFPRDSSRGTSSR